ncbi:MAG: 30S ribosomal protein S13 [Candidatus Paceibacterota bacterium]|jgi:small subunit ribosomal protein S13|nr:30S ribosomal protein S13 [Candidatus Paceibacterota bacterium]MDD5621428.1 30S ribosomal protein S13 [Candidatus Paceibacterota bacterium]
MARISGVNLPNNKQIIIALSYIYGIGDSLSKKILETAKIDPAKKAGDLTNDEVSIIQQLINKSYKVEGDLRKEKMISIKRLKEIGCWRGHRHARGLPVRGQTTRVNSRTIRGNLRKTVGSGRKAAPGPT